MARRVSSPQIVGRADALAAITAALDRAAEGEPAVVLVSGEAGVGKTRVVREAARAGEERGAQLLWGECVATGNGELPYAPLVGALRPLVADLRGADRAAVLGDARDELARLLPALGPGDDRAPATEASPQRLFELLLGVLGRLGERAPVMLVIEDVHWADVATEHLLAFLVRNLRSQQLLVLVTWRTDEPRPRDSLQRLLAELIRDARVQRVELESLAREETVLQVRGIVGTDAGALGDWAHARGGGNPYFTEELVATREAGLDGVLPDSLRAVLLTRMAGVSAAATRVLRVVATAGDRVEHDVVERAAGLDDAATAAAVHELLDAHVLARERDSSRYGFRHALAREALYGELLASERQALHASVASVLEAAVGALERGAAEWAALAHHWHAAGDPRRALGAAIAAAEAATAVYAYADARHQLERARTLWTQLAPADRPDGIDEAELLRRLADAARLGGRWDEALPIADAALAALPASADPRRAARLELLISTLHRDTRVAVAHARRALELLPPGPSAERSAAALRTASAYVYGELPSDQRALALEALEAARAAGATADEGAAYRLIGSALAWGGQVEGGLTYLRKARDAALAHESHEDYVRAIDYLGAALHMLGRTDEALATYEGAMEQVRRFGLVLSHGSGSTPTPPNARFASAAGPRRGRASRGCSPLAPSTRTRGCSRSGSHCCSPRAREKTPTLPSTSARRSPSSTQRLTRRRGLRVPGPHGACARARRSAAGPHAARRREGTDRFGDLQLWPALLNLGLRAEADLAERVRHRGEPTADAQARRATADELAEAVWWYGFEIATVERAPPETFAHWDIAHAELARIEASRSRTSGGRSPAAGMRPRSPTKASTHACAKRRRICKRASAARRPRRCGARTPPRWRWVRCPCAATPRRLPNAPASRCPRSPVTRRTRDPRSTSPGASSPSSSSSRPGGRTGRSPRSCTPVCAPSTSTSATSSPSFMPPIAWRRPAASLTASASACRPKNAAADVAKYAISQMCAGQGERTVARMDPWIHQDHRSGAP